MAILGGAAVLLTSTFLQQQRAIINAERQKILEEYGRPVPVIVARNDLQEGHLLTTDDIGMRPISEKFIAKTASDRAEDVLGLVTKVPFSSGEVLLRDKLRPKNEVPKDEGTPNLKLSELMPTGKRAVTIELDEISGVGGFIKPGDVVDVLWTFQNTENNPTGEPVTLAIFQRVPVLAVDDQLMGSKDTEGDSRSHGSTATLALSPEETAFLLFARKNGEIQLSLVAKEDKEKAGAPVAANKRALLKKVLGDKAVSDPETKRQIEVFKGLDRKAVPISQQ